MWLRISLVSQMLFPGLMVAGSAGKSVWLVRLGTSPCRLLQFRGRCCSLLEEKRQPGSWLLHIGYLQDLHARVKTARALPTLWLHAPPSN